MKYLKTWMGVSVSSGVGMGDSGGYRERQFELVETLDALVRSFDPKAEYFKLIPADVKPAVDAVKELAS